DPADALESLPEDSPVLQEEDLLDRAETLGDAPDLLGAGAGAGAPEEQKAFAHAKIDQGVTAAEAEEHHDRDRGIQQQHREDDEDPRDGVRHQYEAILYDPGAQPARLVDDVAEKGRAVCARMKEIRPREILVEKSRLQLIADFECKAIHRHRADR